MGLVLCTSSMDILKVFSLCDATHSINIQGTHEEPLFQANQIGKILGMKNINKQIKDWNTKLKVVTESYTLGGIQKVSFLTEKGLYRIINRSNKPIAEKFQDWVEDIIKEIRLTGQYKIQQQKEIEIKLIQTQEKQKTHKKMIELFHQKNIVYVCKMKEIEEPMRACQKIECNGNTEYGLVPNTSNKFIIKIGSSQDIKQRMTQLPIEYNMIPLLLDVFESVSHVRLEKNIHKNTGIKSLQHQLKKKDNTLSRETYLVNEDEYENIIQIIKKEIKKISTEEEAGKMVDLEIKKTELEIKKTELETKKTELETINKKIEFQEQQKQEPIQEPMVEPTINPCPEPLTIKNAYIRNRENARSPKVYQYDPETKELIKIYDSVIATIRDIDGAAYTPLKTAAKNNTIYKGFRWLFVDKTKSEEPILPPTVEIRTQEVRLVAMIDIQQTKIMEVFDCQKNAAISRKLEGFSTISRAIKSGGISSGHYWKWWDDCSPEMKQAYLEHHKLPEKHVSKNGCKVLKMHPLTDDKIHTYYSITDVLMKYQMSRATLKKISDSNEVYNGFKWRIVS